MSFCLSFGKRCVLSETSSEAFQKELARQSSAVNCTHCQSHTPLRFGRSIFDLMPSEFVLRLFFRWALQIEFFLAFLRRTLKVHPTFCSCFLCFFGTICRLTRRLGEMRNDSAPVVDRVWRLDRPLKGTKTTNADRHIAAPYSEAIRENFRFDHRCGIAIG